LDAGLFRDITVHGVATRISDDTSHTQLKKVNGRNKTAKLGSYAYSPYVNVRPRSIL